MAAYVGTGENRWAAAHVSDVADLYHLAVEKHETGARYHAVGEEGVQMRNIAEAIGRGLKIPVSALSGDEAGAHFGWLSQFVGSDLAATSTQTRHRLGWFPSGPGMISDLDHAPWA